MGKLKFEPMVPPLTKEDIDKIMAGDIDLSNVSVGDLTYDKIVSEFKSTGKYYNIDYPGGILQLVKDCQLPRT